MKKPNEKSDSPNPILHVGAPNIGNEKLFKKYLNEILGRRWLTNNGEVVQEFERQLCSYLGVKHCIPMNNGTVALEIAIRALNLESEVIIPSLTFVATAHALQWQEIKPVFCDIDRQSYCIDPDEIERHITPRTTGIMGVHLYSRPCDIEALQQIAERHGLKLLFDAAHAFGCTYKNKMIGNFGDCEVLSFHATKFFNTFEGGAIATNDDDLAEKIRLMQNFGFAGEDKVIYLGTNGKMNEVSAAMGLANLSAIDQFLKVNQRNYETYRKGIRNIEGLSLIDYDESENCNRQYIVLEVGDNYPSSRDELVSKLKSNNVMARKYFWPGCHNMEPYRSLQPNAGMLLPVTEDVSTRLMVLPTGTAVDMEDVRKILNLMK